MRHNGCFNQQDLHRITERVVSSNKRDRSLRKVVSGLIVEGTSGTGKSEVLRQIVHEAWHPKPLTPLTILRERDTLRSVLKGRSPEEIRAQADQFVPEIKNMLASIISEFVDCRAGGICPDGEDREAKTPHRYLIDRFHLTAASWYTDGDLTPWVGIDEMLAGHGFKLVLLYWSEERFEEMFEQLLKARGSQWERFLESLAPDRAGQIEHFLGDQRKLLRAANQSQLEILRIDTSEQDWIRYTRQAIRFWGL